MCGNQMTKYQIFSHVGETTEVFDITNLACYDELQNVDRLNRSLGTLGSGNHFIEVDESSKGEKYLIIHTDQEI